MDGAAARALYENFSNAPGCESIVPAASRGPRIKTRLPGAIHLAPSSPEAFGHDPLRDYNKNRHPQKGEFPWDLYRPSC